MATFICGIDEVGRGALAGPVCVAAVIMHHEHNQLPIGLNDSKKLSEKRRLQLAKEIKTNFTYSIGWVMPNTIDRINILQATLLAMQQAILRLPQHIKNESLEVRIDGNQAPKLAYPTRTIIKGDQSEPSIMMASIIAKVTRDQYMQSIAQWYPEYGFASHVGYPTAKHKAAIALYGQCPIHRLSFKSN